jgi:hypothetical protein
MRSTARCLWRFPCRRYYAFGAHPLRGGALQLMPLEGAYELFCGIGSPTSKAWSASRTRWMLSAGASAVVSKLSASAQTRAMRIWARERV